MIPCEPSLRKFIWFFAMLAELKRVKGVGWADTLVHQ
jgi:hypothetical protein